MPMSEAMKATPRVKSIQRAALAMLVVAGVINYVDRATLAVANPLIRQDLGLNIAEMGYLLSAFLGPTRSRNCRQARWSTALAALAPDVRPRSLVIRPVPRGTCPELRPVSPPALLGVGEAPQFPTCARVVRDWFHPRDRGLATGIWNCSSSLGTAIAVPLLTFLMLSFGWRMMFMIMGVAGLAMAAVWYVFYRNPSDVDLTAEEIDYRTQGDPPGQRTVVTLREWKRLFRFRTTWGMILGYFGCIYLTWIYAAWLPGYLEIERHMSVKFTGFAAAVPFAWGVVGGVLAGYIADILVRRGVSPVKSRRYPATIALCGTAACTIAAAFVTSNALAIAFISASLFLVYVTSTCAWALTSVAAPTNCTASIGAMQNFGGYLGGALAPTVTGLIVQQTGSFVPALVVGALIGVASAGSYFFIVDQPITAADLDAVAQESAAPVPARGA